MWWPLLKTTPNDFYSIQVGEQYQNVIRLLSRHVQNKPTLSRDLRQVPVVLKACDN